MAKRRQYIRDWWIDDIRAPWLGRGEILIETAKGTFVLVVDDQADLLCYLDAARTMYRKWLKELMGVQNMLAPELRATVEQRGE